MTTETRNDKRTRGGPRKLKSRASRNRPRAAIRQKQPQFLEFFDRYKGTLPESISQADLILLNAALSFLFAHLREARRQFDEEGDAGRLGAFTARGALVQFILIFKKPNFENSPHAHFAVAGRASYPRQKFRVADRRTNEATRTG